MLTSLAAFFINTWVVVLKVRLRIGSLNHLMLASVSSWKSSLSCVARFSSVHGARVARNARFARGVFYKHMGRCVETSLESWKSRSSHAVFSIELQV